MSNTFYQDIPCITSISEITNRHNYHDVPKDWYIALSDVIGSTKAIQNGRYKDVNALAAASITALLNCVPMDIPFVFGGDGATILVPPEVAEKAREALMATQRMASEQFNLDLRVGIIPVRDVLEEGYTIRLTKLLVSENFQQAIFTGGGISQAERLLKDPERGKKYLLQAQSGVELNADFSGFECRWNEIPGKHEETVSLIVQAIVPDTQEQYDLYSDVLDKIEEIYGSADIRHPLTPKKLRLNILPWKFITEARIRYRDTSFGRLWRIAKGTFKANVAMWLDIQNWGSYKQILIDSTDSEKFDDTLRMIISGTKQQREMLRDYLESQRSRLVYGTHVSETALITCIVFDYFGRQVHFVDGSNGGYALAAKEMKAQLVMNRVMPRSDIE